MSLTRRGALCYQGSRDAKAMTKTLLLEIGCEELPTSFLADALGQLEKLLPEELGRARLGHGHVRVLGTPRRLAVLVAGVADGVEAREEEILGPAESAAKGKDGGWSKAAEGFARKNEVSLDDLSIVETPKGRYLQARKRSPGADAASLLPGVLAAACRRIAFAKSMRWADGETAFGRPIQWLVALHGETVVPFEFAELTAGRVTYGHRFLAPERIEIASADVYESRLSVAKVLADTDARRVALLGGLEAAAAHEGGDLRRDAFLEGEVLGLVEWPHVVVGRFEDSYLTLPDALIESVMRGHQRYFAVEKKRFEDAQRDPAGGRLLPLFLTVVNTALDPDTIRLGNERVMRARLKDAAFFVAQDRKTPLADRVPSLDAVTFHARLGSYGDKTRRLARLAPFFAAKLGCDGAEAARAATLAKADLVSLAVGEFPELQGLMGGFYAGHDGEPAAVAAAIAEHYQPRGSGDAVAPSKLGAAVALADRFDTLVGCLGVGLRPTGGEDPFGLRRMAIAILRTVLAHRTRLDLAEATRAVVAVYLEGPDTAARRAFAENPEAIVGPVVDFVSERLKGILEERSGRDPVAACMAAGKNDPVDVDERVAAVDAFWKTPAAADLAVAFKRVFNISREAPAGALTAEDRARLSHPAEVALLEAFDAAETELQGRLAARDFVGAMAWIARALRAPVDRLFVEVFVMDKDETLRASRLRLLGRVADRVGQLARFDALE